MALLSSCLTWGFLEYERLAFQAAFTCLLVYLIVITRRLIRHGIEDREARMLSIKALQETAAALEKRTAALQAIRSGKDSERFDHIDTELKRNSELTQAAETASATAAEVANSMNEKISKGQDRLREHIESGEK